MEEHEDKSEFQLALEAEEKKWDALNVNIDGIAPAHGMLGLAARVRLIMDTLVERDVIDAEELQVKWQEYLLNELRMVREAMTPVIQEQRRNMIRNGIAPPGLN